MLAADHHEFARPESQRYRTRDTEFEQPVSIVLNRCNRFRKTPVGIGMSGLTCAASMDRGALFHLYANEYLSTCDLSGLRPLVLKMTIRA